MMIAFGHGLARRRRMNASRGPAVAPGGKVKVLDCCTSVFDNVNTVASQAWKKKVKSCNLVFDPMTAIIDYHIYGMRSLADHMA